MTESYHRVGRAMTTVHIEAEWVPGIITGRIHLMSSNLPGFAACGVQVGSFPVPADIPKCKTCEMRSQSLGRLCEKALKILRCAKELPKHPTPLLDHAAKSATKEEHCGEE